MSTQHSRKMLIVLVALFSWVLSMVATRPLAASWMSGGIEGYLKRTTGRSMTLAEARVTPEWSFSPVPFVSVGSVTCVAGTCAFGQWVVAVNLPGVARDAWFFG